MKCKVKSFAYNITIKFKRDAINAKTMQIVRVKNGLNSDPRI